MLAEKSQLTIIALFNRLKESQIYVEANLVIKNMMTLDIIKLYVLNLSFTGCIPIKKMEDTMKRPRKTFPDYC
jgi:hypothetical protein